MTVPKKSLTRQMLFMKPKEAAEAFEDALFATGRHGYARPMPLPKMPEMVLRRRTPRHVSITETYHG
jgi:hypothetical protein